MYSRATRPPPGGRFDWVKSWQARESSWLADSDYVTKQPVLTWPQRSQLVGFLAKVRNAFGFSQETLYQSVNTFDRFLSSRTLEPERVRLLITAALFVAMREQNEDQVRSLSSFNEMIGLDALEDIELAEQDIQNELSSEISDLNPSMFLQVINKVDGDEEQSRLLAHYFLEVMLFDERFIGIVPSLMAAISYHLARQILEQGPWVSKPYSFIVISNETRHLNIHDH